MLQLWDLHLTKTNREFRLIKTSQPENIPAQENPSYNVGHQLPNASCDDSDVEQGNDYVSVSLSQREDGRLVGQHTSGDYS